MVLKYTNPTQTKTAPILELFRLGRAWKLNLFLVGIFDITAIKVFGV
jgi:hypothetical protein